MEIGYLDRYTTFDLQLSSCRSIARKVQMLEELDFSQDHTSPKSKIIHFRVYFLILRDVDGSDALLGDRKQLGVS